MTSSPPEGPYELLEPRVKNKTGDIPNTPTMNMDSQQEAKPEEAVEECKDGEAGDETQYLSSAAVALLMVAISLAMFLVSLDRTIVATAVPKITDHFNSFGDIGWYASAYALTGCAMQLPLGRFYSFYTPKWVFLSLVVLFEIGSAICAGAFNSNTIIIGRAIQGIGCAGVFSGSMILLVDNVPLQKRPLFMGMLMAIMSVSAIVGPLIGGALTSNASWRWCFIINIPIGTVTILILLLIVKPTPGKEASKKSPLEHLKMLDPLGAALLIPAVICLVLALQWGGSEYAWKSWQIVLLLVFGGLLGIAFMVSQKLNPEIATISPRIVKQRTVAAGFYYSTCTGGAMMTVVYWIPIWFQAIKNASPVKSGEMTIPLLISQSLGSISGGILVSQVVGYASPFMILSSVMMAVGAGLLSTLSISSAAGKWIGYQVLFGFGLGIGQQQPSTAVQVVLKKDDIPSAISLIFFGMQLGGSVCVCIGQNVLNQELIKSLTKARIPGLDPMAVLHTGATELENLVHSALEKTPLLLAYNHSLTSVFYVASAVGALSIIGSVLVEWKSVKGMKPAH
ncbi:major facilitator superfamily transporter [Lindgomyces ingoldianus]|uniref:Major facilitator superfamily transporter n=1 Tax=Lindgomyces ingoldianus TaxID=673940 RepID=A0ACB6RAB2_9PLEO|nr:major facilitator superfamily transporter [Lindgomyces ingoldianus]KAF2475267.1 major facilitator superfamily transporter [Lindgomyces ingoldianus]